MSVSVITLEPAISPPDATLQPSTNGNITPKWLITHGPNARVDDTLEAEYTLASDPAFAATLGMQTAVIDIDDLSTGDMLWANQPQLVNGDYIFRFHSIRAEQTTAWSASKPVTANGNFGIDLEKPSLSLPQSTPTGDNTATIAVTTSKGDDSILYYFLNSVATPPLPEDIVSAAGSGQQVTVSVPGIVSINLTGLQKGSRSYPFWVQKTKAGIFSDVVGGPVIQTTDSTAPVLSNPNAVATSPTTANYSVVTDQPLGTTSVVASTSITKPTDIQIEQGKDHTGAAVPAGRARAQAVVSPGTISFNDVNALNFTGLPSGANIYFHAVHRDELGQPSNIPTYTLAIPAAPDITPPVVAPVQAISTSGTTGRLQWSTNEGNGLGYGKLTTTNVQPSIAAMEATAPQAIGSPGIKTFDFTGLTLGQLYYGWGFQRDAATPVGNPSAVVAIGSFTTNAANLKTPIIDPIHIPDASKPQFNIRCTMPVVGDEFRLAWTGPSSGFADQIVTAAMLTPNFQFTWATPSFAKNVPWTYTVRHKRGSDTATSAGSIVTFLDSPGVPPPVDDTNYLLRKDNVSRILRKNGIDFIIRY